MTGHLGHAPQWRLVGKCAPIHPQAIFRLACGPWAHVSVQFDAQMLWAQSDQAATFHRPLFSATAPAYRCRPLSWPSRRWLLRGRHHLTELVKVRFACVILSGLSSEQAYIPPRADTPAPSWCSKMSFANHCTYFATPKLPQSSIKNASLTLKGHRYGGCPNRQVPLQRHQQHLTGVWWHRAGARQPVHDSAAGHLRGAYTAHATQRQ